MRKINSLPSFEQLHEWFSYDPVTGFITWKIRPSKRSAVRAGDLAGNERHDGYLRIMRNRREYLTHRIIWKMMTRSDPNNLIDHKDGCKTNNSWNNLREATDSQSNQNCGIEKRNKTGIKGVTFDSRSHRRKKWRAIIKANGIRYLDARFSTKEEAALAIEMHRQHFHGEFARAE